MVDLSQTHISTFYVREKTQRQRRREGDRVREQGRDHNAFFERSLVFSQSMSRADSEWPTYCILPVCVLCQSYLGVWCQQSHGSVGAWKERLSCQGLLSCLYSPYCALNEQLTKDISLLAKIKVFADTGSVPAIINALFCCCHFETGTLPVT